MNKKRLKKVEEALQLLRTAKDLIDAAAEEEREAYDNLSEGLQQTDKGQQSGEAADNLESAQSSLDDAIGNLEEVESNG